MKKLVPYLVFPGNCKEAMEFYAEVFKGEIAFMQTFRESPVPTPSDFENRIFNSEVKIGNVLIKASDDLPSHQVAKGTNISLHINFSDAEEKKQAFEKLSEGGKVLFPIEDNFGMVKDKYGTQWMVINE